MGVLHLTRLKFFSRSVLLPVKIKNISSINLRHVRENVLINGYMNFLSNFRIFRILTFESTCLPTCFCTYLPTFLLACLSIGSYIISAAVNYICLICSMNLGKHRDPKTWQTRFERKIINFGSLWKECPK